MCRGRRHSPLHIPCRTDTSLSGKNNCRASVPRRCFLELQRTLTVTELACKNSVANDKYLCIKWMGRMRKAWGPCLERRLHLWQTTVSSSNQRGRIFAPLRGKCKPCIGGSVVGTAQPLPQGGTYHGHDFSDFRILHNVHHGRSVFSAVGLAMTPARG